MTPRSGSGAWGNPPDLESKEDSELWALAAKLLQPRRGDGEDDSDEETEELPAYMFRMGLGEAALG